MTHDVQRAVRGARFPGPARPLTGAFASANDRIVRTMLGFVKRSSHFARSARQGIGVSPGAAAGPVAAAGLFAASADGR